VRGPLVTVGALAFVLTGCGAGAERAGVADVPAAGEPVRPRACSGGGAIFSQFGVDSLTAPTTALAAVKAAEPPPENVWSPRYVGYQVVERTHVRGRTRLEVVAWDHEGFARRGYSLERGRGGGWGIHTSYGCPELPADPRPTDNDLA
jgi:hypothetical protein